MLPEPGLEPHRTSSTGFIVISVVWWKTRCPSNFEFHVVLGSSPPFATTFLFYRETGHKNDTKTGGLTYKETVIEGTRTTTLGRSFLCCSGDPRERGGQTALLLWQGKTKTKDLYGCRHICTTVMEHKAGNISIIFPFMFPLGVEKGYE